VSSYWLLLVVRFCFGVGEAGAYPNAAAVIGRWIPSYLRTRAWGVVWMTSQVGAAVSPLLVLPLQVRYGWRVPFFVFGIVGVAWAAVWYGWFRDSPADKPGISREELKEIGPPATSRHGGLPWGRALRQPMFWNVALIGASYVYSLGFYQAWLQTYLARGHGYSEAALALSSLTYVIGACSNAAGGVAGDWLVRRLGLTRGRRVLGVVGLGTAAVFMSAATLATNGNWALAFLSLAYGGILLQQPNLCAVCLDIGRQHAGAVFGFMNTASNGASALSSVVFGYIVAYSGSYNAPLIPMAAGLVVGAFLWLRIDPAHQLFEEPTADPLVHVSSV
jgi:MFS family permease